MIIKGRIGYNSQQDRMCMLIADLWEGEGFHCGEVIEASINGEWQEVRIEYDDSKGWYFAGTPINQEEMEGMVIRCEER